MSSWLRSEREAVVAVAQTLECLQSLTSLKTRLAPNNGHPCLVQCLKEGGSATSCCPCAVIPSHLSHAANGTTKAQPGSTTSFKKGEGHAAPYPHPSACCLPLQLLCVIPRSAILSPRTSRLAAVLEQERLGGGLALTIAVMYEASLGADSKW